MRKILFVVSIWSKNSSEYNHILALTMKNSRYFLSLCDWCDNKKSETAIKKKNMIREKFNYWIRFGKKLYIWTVHYHITSYYCKKAQTIHWIWFFWIFMIKVIKFIWHKWTNNNIIWEEFTSWILFYQKIIVDSNCIYGPKFLLSLNVLTKQNTQKYNNSMDNRKSVRTMLFVKDMQWNCVDKVCLRW